jgi:hypothetical protein
MKKTTRKVSRKVSRPSGIVGNVVSYIGSISRHITAPAAKYLKSLNN